MHKKNKRTNIISERKLTTTAQKATQLFQDDRSTEHNKTQASTELITRSEVENAIRLTKTRKTMGPNEIPTAVLKLLRGNGSKLLPDIFNAKYYCSLHYE